MPIPVKKFFRRDLAFPALVFVVIWWILTGGPLLSWLVGIPAIIFALLITRLLPPLTSPRLQWKGAIFFFIFFCRQSVVSALDVTYRAIHPERPLSPALLYYPLRLKNDFARVVFANTISLLPGTLSVNIQENQILVHTLDEHTPVIENLKLLEAKVASFLAEEFSQ